MIVYCTACGAPGTMTYHPLYGWMLPRGWISLPNSIICARCCGRAKQGDQHGR